MPPFHSKLTSYNVCALILSYFGYREKIKNILRFMNRNSREYFLSHKETLRAFIMPYVPPHRAYFEKVMVFGEVT